MVQKNHLIQHLTFKDKFNLIVATGFGLGLIPIAPGTFGALLGVLIHVSIIFLVSPNLHTIILLFFLLIISIANHLLTPWAQKYWQSADPRHFILDEIAGYLVVPILFHQWKTWHIVLWGFILFRIFDIIKIPPAKQIDQKLKNSWGILLDDIVSGLYAVVTLYCISWLIS